MFRAASRCPRQHHADSHGDPLSLRRCIRSRARIAQTITTSSCQVQCVGTPLFSSRHYHSAQAQNPQASFHYTQPSFAGCYHALPLPKTLHNSRTTLLRRRASTKDAPPVFGPPIGYESALDTTNSPPLHNAPSPGSAPGVTWGHTFRDAMVNNDSASSHPESLPEALHKVHEPSRNPHVVDKPIFSKGAQQAAAAALAAASAAASQIAAPQRDLNDTQALRVSVDRLHDLLVLSLKHVAGLSNLPQSTKSATQAESPMSTTVKNAQGASLAPSKTSSKAERAPPTRQGSARVKARKTAHKDSSPSPTDATALPAIPDDMAFTMLLFSAMIRATFRDDQAELLECLRIRPKEAQCPVDISQALVDQSKSTRVTNQSGMWPMASKIMRSDFLSTRNALLFKMFPMPDIPEFSDGEPRWTNSFEHQSAVDEMPDYSSLFTNIGARSAASTTGGNQQGNLRLLLGAEICPSDESRPDAERMIRNLLKQTWPDLSENALKGIFGIPSNVESEPILKNAKQRADKTKSKNAKQQDDKANFWKAFRIFQKWNAEKHPDRQLSRKGWLVEFRRRVATTRKLRFVGTGPGEPTQVHESSGKVDGARRPSAAMLAAWAFTRPRGLPTTTVDAEAISVPSPGSSDASLEYSDSSPQLNALHNNEAATKQGSDSMTFAKPDGAAPAATALGSETVHFAMSSASPYRTSFQTSRRPYHTIRTIVAKGQRRFASSQRSQMPSPRSASALIPSPTPFVPDVQTFLTLIGRSMTQHASKLTSWDALFGTSSLQLRNLGVEPARSRRYLLWWRDRFRRGMYGPGGSLTQIADGTTEVQLVPIAADRYRLVNVYPGTTAAEAQQATHEVSTSEELEVHWPEGMVTGRRWMTRPDTDRRAIQLTRVEGLWEIRRGHKVKGGERKRLQADRAERLRKKRGEDLLDDE